MTTAICPVCGREINTLKSGAIRQHGPVVTNASGTVSVCPGTYTWPSRG